ncbi:hypothetical protein AAFF_G00176020 [Aldrovandia affinis]|uniref:Mesothelin-like protein n=1 Tax=Aldrovandia affinis TaxID=143900 RepID=A0AAD7RL58_9TELE|nr:hypothetical protein AAFF_G00176020 [Aldrovandia affinis]
MGHHRHPFLILFIAAIGFGYLTASPSAQIGHNVSSTGGMCNNTEHICSSHPNFTVNNFLHCVGLSMNMSDGKKHIQNLKGVIDETLDVYSFLISNISQGPILELGAHVVGNLSEGEQFQDVSFIKAWFHLKLKPRLRIVSRPVLSCLSTKNFSCETYQTMVKELSLHFSSLDPARQKWIYMFFMYPFLSRNSTAGCVSPGDDSQMWLMKNFGAFSVLARFQDFIKVNSVFSGLEVLNLLTPEQKAELLLHPDVGGLDNGTISLVFESLLKPLQNNHHLNQSGAMVNSSMPPSAYNQSAMGFHHLKEKFKNILQFVKPLRKFIRHFVSLTQQTNLTSMKSHKLTQAVLNWTLAELADHFPKNLTLSNDTKPNALPSRDNFNISKMEDWFQHIVVPVLRPFLNHNQTKIPQDLITVFYHVFSLNSDMDPEPSGPPDICSATMDEHSCSIPNTVENLANVMSCVARSNLTKENLKPLILKLSGTLNSLIVKYSKMNMSSMGSPLFNSSARPQMDSFTSGNFQDVDFIHLWFQAKLRPVLPSVSAEFLSCLSKRNFSCQSYQALVMALSNHMSSLDEKRQQLVYTHFIQRFLWQQQYEGSSCILYTNSSTDWVIKNFGGFSAFANLNTFLYLNSNFSALEALAVLTPLQTAQLLVMPHSGPPEKDVIINAVFDHLFESPKDRKLSQFLHDLVMLSKERPMICCSYQNISKRLHQFLASMPKDLEPALWAGINGLMHTLPIGCTMIPVDDKATLCPFTQWNEVTFCAGVDSRELQHYLDTGMTRMICNFSITEYACSSLAPFTSESLAELLKCKLSGNMTYSREAWKLFITKASGVLDEALPILSNMSLSLNGPSVPHVLDMIREIRINKLSEEKLKDVGFIEHWFHGNLRPFLSSVSGQFLSCLSSNNLTCESYHHVVKEFSYQFPSMDEMRQHMVLRYFIQPFLTQNHTLDPACIHSTNGSVGWLRKNYGPYSALAPLQDLLLLNRNFSALEALALLSPQQAAQLLVLPHPGAPKKDVIINAVFDHFLESPKDRELGQFLHDLVMLAREEKISCESYKTIFTRLDQAATSGSNEFKSMSTAIRAYLTQMALQGCTTDEINPGCLYTPVNESGICAGFNSSALASYLSDGNTTKMLCNGSLRHYVCLRSLTHLTAEDVVTLLSCKLNGNTTYSKETWKLFFTKVSGVLDEALLMFSNMSHNLSNPSVTHVLDVLGEIFVYGPSTSTLADVDLVNTLFQRKLLPFLPFASQTFLSCLGGQNFSCETYQAIVKIASHNYRAMDKRQRTLTYTYFIQFYLSQTNTSDPGCVSSSNSSAQWLQLNFGEFASFLKLQEIMRLNRNFSLMDALPHLTLEQLAEVSATPGQLKTPRDVNKLMAHVPDTQLGVFFDRFSPAIEGRSFPVEVRSAMLQQVLDRGNLSDPLVNDTEVKVWLERLEPLLPNMAKNQVTPFFNIVRHRDCDTNHEAVELLNAVRPTLSNDTESAVNAAILLSLKEPTPLNCYSNQSFYLFLQRSFLDFQFPKLSTFLSLIPQNRTAELINSMPPSELGSFLRRPMAVANDTELCTVFNHYNRTPEFLEQEKVPDHVRRQILPCVWPLALRSDSEIEVNKWFEVRLRDYLKFLNKDLLSSKETLSAMCLPFRRIVSELGNSSNYNNSDISEDDVYDTIKTYLKTDGTPKCYSTTDPQLNSTAWFVNYFGVFINYITLDDFRTFGSEEELQIFSVNPENIELFSLSGIPENVTSHYTELIFLQDPTFNATRLPPRFQCDVPGEAYSQLDEGQSLAVLNNLNQSCLNVDNQIYSALAGNIQVINSVAITALGNEVTGLSSAQIAAASPQDIIQSLQLLGSAPGWTQGQTITIIRVLSAGNFQFDSKDKLVQLGSIIGGVPSGTISKINPAVLQETAADPTFIANILSAPQIVQETYVSQIIKLDNAPQKLLENIPDEMATEIPRRLLSFSTSADSVVVQKINQKKWKSEQAVLFFDTVANGISNADDISPDMLQGFTCTRVQTFKKTKIKQLIKACRRRKNRRKVILKETQLTCMYNNIKDEKLQTFTDFPPDMLLYYNYADVQQANCKSYFKATGIGNFNVLSKELDNKKIILLDNARGCLNITGTNIKRENVEVLGNMCCTLNEQYINDSDPRILENLKNCEDLSDTQVTAVENVLVRGNTKYGQPAKWNRKTLEALGVLPLYLQKNFWGHFKKRDIRKFLKKFLKTQRKDKTEKKKLKRLFKAVSGYSRVKRAADQCTVGNITQVTISDEAFPFGYDSTQFNHCLSVEVVKNNLAGLSEKVDDDDFQRIILAKLNQAYPSGIADEQVQLLRSVSRVASLDDIGRWNISTIDTLAALMVASDGKWEADKSKAIITKYLTSNTLGTSELNLIGGPNLCSLDSNVLGNISASSLRDANPLDVSICSVEQKMKLFTIALAAFQAQEMNSTSLTAYQLMKPYLGGAPLDYIQQLSTSNVSMDIQTFINLNESVVLALGVQEVKQIMGANLFDLKTFENWWNVCQSYNNINSHNKGNSNSNSNSNNRKYNKYNSIWS